jgi:hypothetical protein
MVQELAHHFDVEKLRNYFASIKHLGVDGQVSISYRTGKEPYRDGLGQAYSNEHEKLLDEKDFVHIVESEKNPIFEVVNQVA